MSCSQVAGDDLFPAQSFGCSSQGRAQGLRALRPALPGSRPSARGRPSPGRLPRPRLPAEEILPQQPKARLT